MQSETKNSEAIWSETHNSAGDSEVEAGIETGIETGAGTENRNSANPNRNESRAKITIMAMITRMI